MQQAGFAASTPILRMALSPEIFIIEHPIPQHIADGEVCLHEAAASIGMAEIAISNTLATNLMKCLMLRFLYSTPTAARSVICITLVLPRDGIQILIRTSLGLIGDRFSMPPSSNARRRGTTDRKHEPQRQPRWATCSKSLSLAVDKQSRWWHRLVR